MGLPRAPRRKVITIPSDDEGEQANETLPPEPSEDEEPAKPQKRGTGKLRPVNKAKKNQPPLPSPSSQDASPKKSPAKAASKARSKTAVKDASKTNGRTINSFFSAATQQKPVAQPSPSSEKPSVPHAEPEAIQDDSDENQGGSLRFAKGSSTVLAMRKRKAQYGENLEPAFSASQPSSQKFRKASSGDRIPTLAIINEDKRPWTEQFAPKDLAELAVHKKKVSDVRQWFEMAFNGRRQRVLVLKGAAGTGKTTAVQLLAQEMSAHVMEWRNPAGVELGADTSTASQFSDFVGRAGRSGGLQLTTDAVDQAHPVDVMANEKGFTSDSDTNILLIEEFPNTFSRTSSTLQAFRSTILQYLASPLLPAGARPTPIVMIISETLLSTNTALADSFTAHRLLGPELANHPYLDMIEFNAVAPTILTKALETIIIKEASKSGRRRTPGPQVLKHIAESGDVRSAVSSLEFLCLRGDDGDTWSSKVQFGKQKKSKTDPPLTKSEEEALRLISNRESTLGIFHAVGKVVYNKRVDFPDVTQPPPWLPQHRRSKVPENDVDDMINELGTDVTTFTAALHENYALSCGSTSAEESMDSLLGCISSISDADLLSVDRFSQGTRAYSGSATDSLRQDEMAFQVAVRGLLFSLPSPVHRGTPASGNKADAHKMYYPASLKLWKQREEVESVLELLTAKFQSSGLAKATMPRAVGGVESWNKAASEPQPDGQANDTARPEVTNSMKTEMLIERLPYMSHILSTKNGMSSLKDQIASVTRIRDAAPIPTDDDAEPNDDDGPSTEQWATDKPDAEAGEQSSSKKRKAKASKAETETEGGGLAIPVESQIQGLVLEEDDIVDD
ncbi:RFC checkpoint protein Rad17 [Saxophila tyrrhenica]|uniref:RFC checkpoint protein Rad17 n=1 Tax=Saxophila tyrrhenica TaxID=1690608 RepID=A0AAV9PM60_9PEZI|nr:RFC checkpoint protein Rad17 [Saxophila tyrrhenica]